MTRDAYLFRQVNRTYPPHCSTNLNPIEKARSKLKQRLRAFKARTKEILDDPVTEALPFFTPANAQTRCRLALHNLH
jgi:transposase